MSKHEGRGRRRTRKRENIGVYANSNSKEEWIHPSSNQASIHLSEGRTTIADMCMTLDFMHVHGSLAVCQAGTSLLARQASSLT